MTFQRRNTWFIIPVMPSWTWGERIMYSFSSLTLARRKLILDTVTTGQHCYNLVYLLAGSITCLRTRKVFSLDMTMTFSLGGIVRRARRWLHKVKSFLRLYEEPNNVEIETSPSSELNVQWGRALRPSVKIIRQHSAFFFKRMSCWEKQR